MMYTSATDGSSAKRGEYFWAPYVYKIRSFFDMELGCANHKCSRPRHIHSYRGATTRKVPSL